MRPKFPEPLDGTGWYFAYPIYYVLFYTPQMFWYLFRRYIWKIKPDGIIGVFKPRGHSEPPHNVRYLGDMDNIDKWLKPNPLFDTIAVWKVKVNRSKIKRVR